MAAVDPKYEAWMHSAARLIVKQMNDGTMHRCGDIGARISDKTQEEAMVSQVVGIMLAHKA